MLSSGTCRSVSTHKEVMEALRTLSFSKGICICVKSEVRVSLNYFFLMKEPVPKL